MGNINWHQIRNMQDLRLEKARLRYEVLMAENSLNDSLHSIERLFTVFALIRRASAGFKLAYSMISKASRFMGRLFSRSDKKQTRQEPDVVRF